MTREEILAGLKEVMALVKPKLDLSGMTEDANLVTDLGIDSLNASAFAGNREQVRIPVLNTEAVPNGSGGDRLHRKHLKQLAKRKKMKVGIRKLLPAFLEML